MPPQRKISGIKLSRRRPETERIAYAQLLSMLRDGGRSGHCSN
jgi:hypothetical protein